MFTYQLNLKDPRKEDTLVLLYLRGGGNLVKLSTEVKVNPKNWDSNAKCIKKSAPYARVDNERLLKWKTAATEAIKVTACENGTLQDVKKRVLIAMGKDGSDSKELFLPYFLKWCTTTTTRRQATRYMLHTYNVFREFAEKDSPTFDDITNAYIEKFIEWMAKRNLGPNTRGNHIKRIKTAMREALDEGIHRNTEFTKFRKEKEQVENIYLTEEEIRRIEELPLCGAWERARDLFVIGCHTAMRFSDCVRLKPEDIHDGIITQKQMKTNEVVSIPCHPKVAEIIEKYHGAPDIPAQSLNSCIKEICREAGICERIGIRRHGAAETTYYEKWELVSSHTARRSAATNMYKAGIPTIAIMKITGHKSERVFMDYIKITNEENAQMLKHNNFFKV